MPITSPSPRVVLLSCKFSFFTSLHTPMCYCKPPPFLTFLKHMLQSLTPHTMLPTHVLSATIRLLHLGLLPLLHTLWLLLGSSFPKRLRYVSCQHSLLQLFPVSCCFCCPSAWHMCSCVYQHTLSALLISAPCLQNLACGR